MFTDQRSVIVSPEAADVLREIHELRAARQRRLQGDLDGIDAAYDRTLRRVRKERGGTPAPWAFPLVKAICGRTCTRASVKRLRRRLARLKG